MNVILARIKENPELKNTLKVQVISQYTWPLPWLLGELKQGAYYGEANAPAELNTDLVFIDQLLEAKFISRLKGNYKRTEVRARQWASSMVIFEKQ